MNNEFTGFRRCGIASLVDDLNVFDDGKIKPTDICIDIFGKKLNYAFKDYFDDVILSCNDDKYFIYNSKIVTYKMYNDYVKSADVYSLEYHIPLSYKGKYVGFDIYDEDLHEPIVNRYIVKYGNNIETARKMFKVDAFCVKLNDATLMKMLKLFDSGE